MEAMRSALAAPASKPADIDYINLHGTATRQNDAMESAAVAEVFGDRVACSSTKPLTGHCARRRRCHRSGHLLAGV